MCFVLNPFLCEPKSDVMHTKTAASSNSSCQGPALAYFVEICNMNKLNESVRNMTIGKLTGLIKMFGEIW